MIPFADDITGMPGLDASITNPFPQPTWMQNQMSPELAGVVDYEAGSALSKDDIIRQINEARDEAYNARQTKEDEWKLYIDLYNNVQDFSQKADWQAKIFIPEIFNKVERAKNMIEGALLSAPEWFTLEQLPKFDPNTQNVTFIEKVLRYELEKAKFIDEYTKCLEEAFILGTSYLKIWWDEWIERKPQVTQVPVGMDPMTGMPFMDPMTGMPMMQPVVSSQPKKTSGLRVKHTPAWAMFPDPFASNFYEGRYVVEECAVDRDYIEEGVRTGMFDSAEDIGPPVSWELEIEYGQRDTRMDRNASRTTRKRDLLRIYHGNFYSHDSKLALQNWRAIVCNNRALLAFGPNTIYTGKWPYISCTPIPVRGTSLGRSLVYAAAPIQYELNNLCNLMIDSTAYSVLPAAIKDADKSDSPVNITTITPGTVYNGREGMLIPLKITSAPNDAWPMIQWLESKIDDSTGINEFMEGTPTTKGRPTAYEIRAKTGVGQEQINNLAKDLERRDLEPAVQLVYDLTLQFLSDFSDPELQAIVQQEMGPQALMDPMTRYSMLDATFKVRARGISMVLTREEQSQKLMELSQMGMSIGLPPANMLQIFYKTAQSMGVDPRELGYPETQQELQMMLMQMQAQQAAGGAGAGPGGKPEAANSGGPQPNGAPSQPPSAEQNIGQVEGSGGY